MNWVIIILIIILIILLLAIFGGIGITNLVVQEDNSYSRALPEKVSKLPLMNLTNVDSAEKYKTFADNTNNLIIILNEQSEWFNIPSLDNTADSWNKISRVLTEYGPLIKNYNEVVNSAKNFESNKNKDSLEGFYISSSKFGFETIMIFGTVFYTASYQTVGVVYRASGLSSLAFKCPKCVSMSLSTTHWTIRNTLVETASLTSKKIMEESPKIFDGISIDSIRSETQQISNSSNIKILKDEGRAMVESIKNSTKPQLDMLKNKSSDLFSNLF